MATRPTLASSKADHHGPNLSQPERMLSMAGGGALLLNGLRSGGLKGGLQLVLGGLTLWRGYKGRCELKAALAHTPMEQEWEAETGWASSKVVSRSITVNKPVEEVIAWCRDPANIGPLIPWVDSIEQTGPDTYRWSVRGPGERTFGWTLIQSEPEPGHALRWNTPGEGVWQHEADARFSPAPQGQGTEIRLVLATEPPKGAPGYALASLISRFTHKALLYLLRALKQQMETGEIATSRARNGERDFLFIHPDHRRQAEPPVAGEPLEGGIH